MLINGKEVEVDFRNAQKIQTKIPLQYHLSSISSPHT